MRKTLLSIACLLSLLLCSCKPDASSSVRSTVLEGQEFASIDALSQHPEFSDYSLGGRFGDAWPATVQTLHQADDEISFTVNGRSHRYPNYTGYHLKVPILIGTDGKEMAFVFRSNSKR